MKTTRQYRPYKSNLISHREIFPQFDRKIFHMPRVQLFVFQQRSDKNVQEELRVWESIPLTRALPGALDSSDPNGALSPGGWIDAYVGYSRIFAIFRWLHYFHYVYRFAGRRARSSSGDDDDDYDDDDSRRGATQHDSTRFYTADRNRFVTLSRCNYNSGVYVRPARSVVEACRVSMPLRRRRHRRRRAADRHARVRLSNNTSNHN